MADTRAGKGLQACRSRLPMELHDAKREIREAHRMRAVMYHYIMAEMQKAFRSRFHSATGSAQVIPCAAS